MPVRPEERGSGIPVGGLAEAELAHLRRMLRRERVFEALVYVNLAAAVLLAVFYTIAASWNPVRAVLVVLVLLAARANLRQARTARLLRRLSSALRIGGL